LYIVAVKKDQYLPAARTSFYSAIVGVFIAAALLLIFILQHRFEYNYISSYSSRELSTALLVTTFWAGQEGSFLLWALFASVIALVLQRFALKKNMEREVMAVYMLAVAFLLMLISIKTPFQYVWDAHPSEIQNGIIPPDGKGLNPLLQNFWMIIHPPVLFLGFASLAVPFAFALGALWQKKIGEWISFAMPWVLFSGLVLGSGLMLGGYWAYGVLGWGGWWGWDPVENSSLVPWMAAIILVHTMLIQLLTGKLVRTNFILAILSYLLVIYSTFLTRSGVLANASVHSFVDPGSVVYSLLVVWLVVAIASGLGMLWLRRKDLKTIIAPSLLLSRESILSLATIVMGASALIICFGTSLPLFSQSTVESSFYDNANLPLAVVMMLLLGISLRAKWNQEERSVFKRILLPAGVAAVLVIGLIVAGLHDVSAIVLVFAALFALIISVEHGIRVMKEQPRFLGSALSHVGIGLLLISILASGKYGHKQSVSLPLNQPKALFGYTLTYTGDSLGVDGKYRFVVRAERNGSTHTLLPVMFDSPYNNSQMRTPDYLSFLTKDFYIEPVSLEPGSENAASQNMIDLTKDEPVEYGPMTITFLRFDLGEHSKGSGMGTGKMTIGAVLEVKTDKGTEQLTPMTTYNPQGNSQMQTATMKSGRLGFQLVAMNVGMGGAKSKVHINVVGMEGMHGAASNPDVFVAEVSVKPYMSCVWVSALLILAGLAVAMLRRIRQKLV
jgi:cytochrome c-type biogenesis protein CcmF